MMNLCRVEESIAIYVHHQLQARWVDANIEVDMVMEEPHLTLDKHGDMVLSNVIPLPTLDMRVVVI
jgi:hypothetical protein